MLKKIDIGKTKFSDLHQLFNFNSHVEFENKKSRLFPIGNTNMEVPTVAIFLSSLSAVKEFREELFLTIGVKKIKTANVAVHTYTELEDDSKTNRPDGLIVITSGKHEPIIEWIGFVEAKVATKQVDIDQMERYIKLSRSLGISNIITISNNLATNPKQNPIADKLKGKVNRFNLYHWSWTYLKVTASRLIKNNVLQDEDHVYILIELRRYFENHKKLSNYINMGSQWKSVAERINALPLKSSIDNFTLEYAVNSYLQEEKDVSLQLTDRSNMHVELIHSKDRFSELKKLLNDKKVFISKFMINGNKNKIFSIEIDFLQLQIRCSVEVVIKTGKAKSQTSQLIRMLESDSGATDSMLITAKYPYNKIKKRSEETHLSKLFDEKYKKVSEYSVNDKAIGDTVKSFEIKTRDIINKQFFSAKNFVKKLEDNAEVFLTQVMVNIKDN